MKTNSLLRSRPLALATVTAAALLALAPGRAAADPSAFFVSGGGGGAYATGYTATGAASGYATTSSSHDIEGIAYNPANNTLYVACFDESRIRTFDATTGANTTLANGFNNVSSIDTPIGLALNAGVLYVANGNGVKAYNAANAAPVTSGFTPPASSVPPDGLAVNGTTLYVTYGDTLKAFNLATGTPLAGFAPITNLYRTISFAIYGNALYASSYDDNLEAYTVSEYDARTGALISLDFVTSENSPSTFAVLGDQLLVTYGRGISAFGLPAVPTPNDGPTSENDYFATTGGGFIAVGVVPEPSTWALLAVGIGALGLTLRQRRHAVRLG